MGLAHYPLPCQGCWGSPLIFPKSTWWCSPQPVLWPPGTSHSDLHTQPATAPRFPNSAPSPPPPPNPPHTGCGCSHFCFRGAGLGCSILNSRPWRFQGGSSPQSQFSRGPEEESLALCSFSLFWGGGQRLPDLFSREPRQDVSTLQLFLCAFWIALCLFGVSWPLLPLHVGSSWLASEDQMGL